MAFQIDPLTKTYELTPPNVSKKIFPISGIITAVYGLDEVPADALEVSCVWLVHARLGTKENMERIACLVVADWNKRLQERVVLSQQAKGLIAVAFDQRNHGSRLVDKLANETWRDGNPSHAHDMFATFQGTARDLSLLIDLIGAYIFPNTDRRITYNLALGVSLGGHATWSCLFHEPQIQSAVILIGCPDFTNLMSHRALLSKLPSWWESSPPGSKFLGSEHFPQTLVDAVRKWDPAALLLSHLSSPAAALGLRDQPLPDPTEEEKRSLYPLMQRCLAGKKILNLSGDVDKLVPYHLGEPFLTWLKKAASFDGWFSDGGVTLEDIIFEGVGHEVTMPMLEQAIRFIGETLAAAKDDPCVKTSRVQTSKM